MTNPSIQPDSSPAQTLKIVAEILPADEFSQFLLYGKSEMLPVLRGLIEQVSQVTMMFTEGRDMVLTSLIRCDEDGLVLDFGASMEMNRNALKADKLFCVTQLGKVKIQFILRGVTQIEVDRRPAFFASLPESILRLQRRGHYRLSTSIMHPLKCRIPLSDVDGSSVLVEGNVTDISGGGFCLAGLPPDVPLEPDMKISGCTIELPEIGSIVATLHLLRVMKTTNRSGVHSLRAGCEFINLPGSAERLIQRYIMKIERERKARESGMG